MIHRQIVDAGARASVGTGFRSRRAGMILLVLLGLGLGLLGAAGIGYGWAYNDRVYPGVYVAGHNLGGLKAAEVRALLARQDMPSGQVALQTADGAHQWTLARQDLGAMLDADALVAAALAYGRSGNLLADWPAQWTAAAGGATLVAATQVDPALVGRAVDKLAAEVDGAAGGTLDRAAAGRLIATALAGPSTAPALILPMVARVPAKPAGTTPATSGAAPAAAAPAQPAGAPAGGAKPVAAPVAAAPLAAVAPVLLAAPLTVRVQDTPASLTLSTADLQAALVAEDAASGTPAHLDTAKIRALLAPLAGGVSIPPQDAQFRLVKGKPVLLTDTAGRDLDLDAATAATIAAAATAERTVVLTLRPVPATISAADAQPVLQQWTQLLAHGFTFRYGTHTWVIRGARLGSNLAVTGNQGGGSLPYRLQVDQAVVASRLAAIAGDLDVAPRNARFRLVDGQVHVVAPARDGQQLDQAASLNAAMAAVAAGNVQADLVVTTQPAPSAGAALPDALATPDLLGRGVTTYHGSSPQRAHNVEFGTSLVDGALVPPGGEFDMNATLGPLTLGAGFQMGFGIVSDGVNVTTVPAEAGGICQVATTLFHSVFWAGLPVTERNHHSYWISSYGVAPSGMQGLDATISPPEKNFRWRNSTGNWILIRAHASAGVVTFELWGTDPHWKVQASSPVITHVVGTSGTAIYENSAALPWGTTRQVEHAQNGFTADIRRQVFDASGTLLDDWHAQGTYLPAHNRYIVGQAGRPPPPRPRPAPAPIAAPAAPAPAAPAAPAATPAAPAAPAPVLPPPGSPLVPSPPPHQ